MKNKERFAKEIVEAVGGYIAVHKITGEIKHCFETIPCKDCIFYRKDGYCGSFEEWANAEYKEPKQFTEREKMFIRLLPNIKYIARDNYGVVCLFTDKPNKLDIYWEDEEPTSREEILGGSDE